MASPTAVQPAQFAMVRATDEAGNVVPMFPVIQQRGAKSAEDLSLIFGGKFLADGDRLNGELMRQQYRCCRATLPA